MAGDLSIRPAGRRDAAELAILVDIASHGFASWLWYGAVLRGETDTAMERGQQRIRDAAANDNWRNASIAEIGGETAGASIGFCIPQSILAEKTDHPVLAPLIALQQQVAGRWFIDTLAVYRQHRRKGVARRLLDHEASRAGGRPLALITPSTNAAALSLYEGFGFRRTGRQDAVPLYEKSEPHQWVLLERH